MTENLVSTSLFWDEFFQDIAGRIVTDFETAIVELIANCWDAGACLRRLHVV